MKVRQGFVSNSSSTSFLINILNIPKELLSKIERLTERSDDVSRCTGKITDIKQWIEELECDEYDVKQYIDNDNIIIIRESDEEMGGCFADYGFTMKDIQPYVIKEFEYH